MKTAPRGNSIDLASKRRGIRALVVSPGPGLNVPAPFAGLKL